MRKAGSAKAVLGVALAVGSFATVPAAVSRASLPDQRRYELVSPPDKNGGDVMAQTARTRAAAGGNAAAFVSLTGFGDVRGTGITAEYVSRRTGLAGTTGWSTHAVLPKLDTISPNGVVTAGFSTFYVGEWAEDLSKALLRTGTNLAQDPNVAAVANLYLRTDMLSAGSGEYALLSGCPVCLSPLTSQQTPAFADASSDFSHVIFESRQNLVSGAAGGNTKLYEWDHGTLRLAGLLPTADGGGAPSRALAGVGASFSRYTPGTISDDGSRVFFTVPSNGFSVTGALYMRSDHSSTVQINVSERTDCAGDPNCGGDGIPDPAPDSPGPAQYQTATADGAKSFFTTGEQLIDSDDGGVDLYQYDARLSDSDPHNLTRISVDHEPADGTDPAVDGVLGTSADGSYVYFLAQGQLVLGAPAVAQGTDGIYLWHEGTTRYIGTLTDTGIDALDNSVGLIFATRRLLARVSPDGRFLLFGSHSGEGLTGYEQSNLACDAGQCAELYLYDADADRLQCVSCNPSEAPATADASIDLGTGRGAAQLTSHLSHALSDDGRYVFFTTGERLVSQDQNGKTRDVYEYDSSVGNVHLLSSGRDHDDSYFLDASHTGHDVFFATREPAVGWDTDNSYDLYDARVGGGLPDPQRIAPECVGDACRGALAAPPSGPIFLSSRFVRGNDNHHARSRQKGKHCKKGKVRKRVRGKLRCAQKHKRGASHWRRVAREQTP